MRRALMICKHARPFAEKSSRCSRVLESRQGVDYASQEARDQLKLVVRKLVGKPSESKTLTTKSEKLLSGFRKTIPLEKGARLKWIAKWGGRGLKLLGIGATVTAAASIGRRAYAGEAVEDIAVDEMRSAVWADEVESIVAATIETGAAFTPQTELGITRRGLMGGVDALPAEIISGASSPVSHQTDMPSQVPPPKSQSNWFWRMFGY